MTGFIYKISNDINSHIYIGKTILTIEERFKEHIKDSKKEEWKHRPLYRAINKYGIEHFTISLVEECNYTILSEREKYWIDFYDSYRNGYNATLGGDGSFLYNYDCIIDLYNKGMLVHEICDVVGCERTVVQRCLKRANIDSFKNSIERSKSPVEMIGDNGQVIKTFSSQTDAANWIVDNKFPNASVNSVRTNIGRVINGIRKTCCGFEWRAKPNW